MDELFIFTASQVPIALPKPLHHINEYCLNRLKQEIILKVGVEVRSRLDCVRMSELLRSDYGVYVSESTLRRVFLSKSNDNHFYTHTLDKLCSVIDIKTDWNSYCQTLQEAREGSLELDYSHAIGIRSTLLYCNFEYGNWKVLNTYFDRLYSEMNESNRNYILLNIGKHLYNVASFDQKFEKALYRNFSSHHLIRKSFFEHCADPDFSLPYYSQGLKAYRMGLDRNSDTYSNDYCFERCMQFLNIHGALDQKENDKLYEDIAYYFPLSSLLKQDIHPYNIGRVIAVMIVHAGRKSTQLLEVVFCDVVSLLEKAIPVWSPFHRRVIQFYCFQGLRRVQAPSLYFFFLEKMFRTSYLNPDAFEKSLEVFFREKEPNAMLWVNRSRHILDHT